MTYYIFGTSPIIKHPQGTYQVAYATPDRTLKCSVLLWFKDNNGRLIPDEDEEWQKAELKKLMVKI